MMLSRFQGVTADVVEPSHANISALLPRYTPLVSLQKPENILFVNDHSFDIKLVDFGSAAIIDNDTVLRDFMATPFYAAPEVWERNYGQECDIWSIGAILYVLVEGLPPSLTRQTAHKNPTWVDLQVGAFVSFTSFAEVVFPMTNSSLFLPLPVWTCG
jgi:serine/threonine protein kinase